MTCRQKKIKVRFQVASLLRRPFVLKALFQCDENKPKCHRCAHGQRDVGFIILMPPPFLRTHRTVHLARRGRATKEGYPKKSGHNSHGSY
jgi:hypothetical protein